MRGMEGYMRGVNLGGWLSQFDAPTREHFDTFITEEDKNDEPGKTAESNGDVSKSGVEGESKPNA